MYDETNPICRLFDATVTSLPEAQNSIDPGYKVGMPWLYYKRPVNQIQESPDY